jgi:hypothetical protein
VNTLQLALLGGALLSLAGCSTTSSISMQVPGPLTASTPLAVVRKQGFKHSYQFGDFATSKVKPGWTSTSTRSYGAWLPVPAWFDQTRAKRKFSFAMQPVAGTAWQVQGGYYAYSKDLSLAPNAQNRLSISVEQEELYSSIIHAPNQPTWQLVLQSQNELGARPKFAQGTLSNGDSLLQVRPISQLLRRDGRPMNLPLGVPVGYEFVRANGSVAAAVELIGRGRVWMAPSLSPEVRGPVAAAVTSMLMMQ